MTKASQQTEQGNSRNRPASHFSRRRFLAVSAASAAAVVAVPHVIPGSALGLEGKVAPSERIGVGMIGMGRQAFARNFPVFVNSRDVQIVALCDVDRWRLTIPDHSFIKGVAKRNNADFSKLKDCYRTTDYRDVLARKDVDAVMITTPDHWHIRIALDAVAAGKDLDCEKPLGQCIAHGRMLADAVKQRGDCVFRTDSEFRSVPVMFDAVKLVRTGKIGEIKKISIAVPISNSALPMQPTMPVPEELDYQTWLGYAPEKPYTEKRVHPRHDYERPGWYCVNTYCDGMITNWGYHPADIAQWGNDTELTGPVEVEGKGYFPPADGLWNTLLNFECKYRYANGVELNFIGLEDITKYQSYVRFEGTEGMVCGWFGPDRLETDPVSIATAKVTPEEFPFQCRNEKLDFIDCVKNRKRTLEDAEVGHRSSSIGQLGFIACRLGRKLNWDPVAEKFPGDEEANKLLKVKSDRGPWAV